MSENSEDAIRVDPQTEARLRMELVVEFLNGRDLSALTEEFGLPGERVVRHELKCLLAVNQVIHNEIGKIALAFEGSGEDILDWPGEQGWHDHYMRGQAHARLTTSTVLGILYNALKARIMTMGEIKPKGKS